ncbi:GNAT family N-acetyltransferase [Paenibacillus sp. GP183]|uniref:GNAT family N-acetyltransferase n=1 Tax=Paenibacillus sp. GP183 TaxID=1882751 RepID=UPI000899ACCF|nr:GNAT family N-acetyltransferase [Paenibacillus sp. GP183]SEB58147.1 Ribosomal protein S18 acetylase RimI [Paenibacillus sp. GP183]
MTIWREKAFTISTVKEDLDIETIFNFLNQESYWAKGVPREVVEKSIENSPLCFGVYKEDVEGTCKQVGFARIITDLATFAYLCDVFVLPNYRGLGLSKWLIDVITNHSQLKGVRRMMLATNDAHSLYAKYGFEQIDKPELFMQINRKNVYKQSIGTDN